MFLPLPPSTSLYLLLIIQLHHTTFDNSPSLSLLWTSLWVFPVQLNVAHPLEWIDVLLCFYLYRWVFVDTHKSRETSNGRQFVIMLVVVWVWVKVLGRFLVIIICKIEVKSDVICSKTSQVGIKKDGVKTTPDGAITAVTELLYMAGLNLPITSHWPLSNECPLLLFRFFIVITKTLIVCLLKAIEH